MLWPFSVPIVAVVGWFVYAIVRTLSRARVRELEIRERIAMIERGLVPPPEKDPNGFDRAMDRYDRLRTREERVEWRESRAPARYRSAGVTMMGVGFGLMLLISFSGGEPGTGIGVGGFIVVMGLAFLINSLFGRRREYYPYYPTHPAPRASPSLNQ